MMHIATDCLKTVVIMEDMPKWDILTLFLFQMQVKCAGKHLVENTR